MTEKVAALLQREKIQSAQGMVEFALVLPILLLILFGIIGFGHLFFSYSLVVNASREAARFGAAVGLTEHSVPRYRDCDEIRANAVRVGSFAGVENSETSVQIQYDKGPKADGSPAEVHGDVEVDGVKDGIGYGCPQGGVGPGVVGLGDRIEVTVSIDYRPIVPLVHIPSFPLTAVTRRTIVLGMPVGDAPVAEAPSCTGTITRIIPPTWSKDLDGSFSVVGEGVTFTVEVIADIPSISAPGTLTLYIEDDVSNPPYTTVWCSGAAPKYTCGSPKVWNTIGSHVIRAAYVSGTTETDTPCYVDTRAEPVVHWVLPADTQTSITLHDPDPSIQDENVNIQVEVVALPPGGGVVEGQVNIFEAEYAVINGVDSERSIAPVCTITLANSGGTARGGCTAPLRNPDSNRLIAVYDEKNAIPYFNSSETMVDHAVEDRSVLTPTVIPSPTPTITPTPHHLCPVIVPVEQGPYAGANIDFYSENTMLLNVRNPGDFRGGISSVEVNWPNTDPRIFLSAVTLNSETIWQSGEGVALGPETQLLNSASAGWNAAAAVIGPVSQKLVVVEFSGAMSLNQTYSVTITFSNDDSNYYCKPLTASGVKEVPSTISNP